MRVLENLEPKKVFYYFEDICNIPHGSGNLDRISSYLAKFAEDRGLYHIRDNANNVIIVKEATKGYEDKESIILQGHMDMVTVKKNGCDINFDTDGLRLKTEGDFVYAEGTSLGGDDGIAVAYMLALLDSDDISHPRIEAVITTDEETGMNGATAIDLSMLKARRMLNIDSEEEGILLTSCAGGMRTDCHIPVTREEKEGTFVSVKVGGMIGGHSGTEINKERGNAIKLLGITLQQLINTVPIQIVDMEGGEKDNAIPREAEALIYVPYGYEKALSDRIAEIEAETKNEMESKEKSLYIRAVTQGHDVKLVMNLKSSRKAIAFLTVIPNGIVAMSADIEGLVETSLNVGILKSGEKEIVTSSAIRSSIESAKHKVFLQVDTLCGIFGGYTESHGDYPGWQFNPDSQLRADMIEIYKKMFGKDVKVEALHAGLECGIMMAKIPGLDCVSFGPDISDIHTTEEKLSISSTERMWNYLIEILKH
jgi:dipeptidase D